MNPNKVYDQIHKENKEVVVPLSGETTYSTAGCKHFWIQVTSTSVRCQKCGLGLFGAIAEDLNKRTQRQSKHD